MSAPKKQAPRLARPAIRYWKGKAPKGAADVNESDSEAEEEVPSDREAGDVPMGDDYADEEDEDLPVRQEPGAAPPRAMNIALKDVSVSKEGRVTVAGRDESGRTALEEEEGMCVRRALVCAVLIMFVSVKSRKRSRKRRM